MNSASIREINEFINEVVICGVNSVVRFQYQCNVDITTNNCHNGMDNLSLFHTSILCNSNI
jgi:hypothetical protein